jgi:calcineurin-like phosphoesterase family protein
MRYFTADLHFGHVNIIEYSKRPHSGVAAMNDNIVDRWNTVVSARDEVMILGDLCMGKINESLEYVKHLNGTLTLLLGNHDRPFEASAAKRGHWEDLYAQAGVSNILSGTIKLSLGKYNVLACHFPYHTNFPQNDHDSRFLEHRPKDQGSWLLHGHVHELWRQRGRMINVGVDAWGGAPVSEYDLINLMDNGPADLLPLRW